MTATETSGGDSGRRTPVHLWIIGVVALLWSAMGAFDYLATQLELESYMGQFSEEQLAYFYGFPKWVVAAWAFGVWGGLAGAIGLLLRKRWAVWAYGISLAGLAISSIHTLVLTSGLEMMGAGAGIMTALIWVLSIFLLCYAVAMEKRGVLT